MPGRNKQPVALLKAKGKTHLTKKDIKERTEAELDVPFREINPPACLVKKSQKEKFREIAGMLDVLGIWTELDADILARYVLAHDEYAAATKQLSKLLNSQKFMDNLEFIEPVQRIQNIAFKQAQACAAKLGLTITDRCKIIAPTKTEKEETNPFMGMITPPWQA